jgi:hypothetical protein
VWSYLDRLLDGYTYRFHMELTSTGEIDLTYNAGTTGDIVFNCVDGTKNCIGYWQAGGLLSLGGAAGRLDASGNGSQDEYFDFEGGTADLTYSTSAVLTFGGNGAISGSKNGSRLISGAVVNTTFKFVFDAQSHYSHIDARTCSFVDMDSSSTCKLTGTAPTAGATQYNLLVGLNMSVSGDWTLDATALGGTWTNGDDGNNLWVKRTS